jgi:hypothetical protein
MIQANGLFDTYSINLYFLPLIGEQAEESPLNNNAPLTHNFISKPSVELQKCQSVTSTKTSFFYILCFWPNVTQIFFQELTHNF